MAIQKEFIKIESIRDLQIISFVAKNKQTLGVAFGLDDTRDRYLGVDDEGSFLSLTDSSGVLIDESDIKEGLFIYKECT